MKRMKRLLSLVLAMMLVLAMGIPVFAAGEGTITIDNAIKGKTYTIYKIFDLESYNNEEGEEAYSYRIEKDSPWYAFVTGEGAGTAYVTVDTQGYVSWKADVKNNAENAKAFAEAAIAFANANSVPNAGYKPADSETVTFTGLDLGYYLVESDAGALVSLDTTQPSVTMKEKNGEPTIDKEVKDGENWADTNTASIGDKVEYRATIDVKADATDYKVHDKMSTGLDFNDDVKVKLIPVGETETENTPDIATTAYTVITEGLGDDCTFHVEFENEYLATLKPGDTLIVYYSATVNKGAEIATTDNPNDVMLDYGDGGHTEWDTTKTYVYEFDVDKFTIREGETDHTQLAGAKFTLSKTVDENNNPVDPITFSKVEEEGLDKDVYKVDKDSSETVITTGESGKFTLSGLAAGTYYLTEIEAPAGYNKLAAPIKVEITEKKDKVTGERTGEFTINGGVTDNTIEVENKTGAELPSTGGIGTTIFYVLGGILVVGAGIMLVVKKRMSSEK